MKIICQCRKTLPKWRHWTKKNTTFDVAMGSYDGADVCELVQIFI